MTKHTKMGAMYNVRHSQTENELNLNQISPPVWLPNVVAQPPL